MSQATICLIVIAVMAALFLINKFKMGLVVMTMCIVLYLTGVLTFQEAFSGLCHTNVIMIAGMMTMSVAITKTSIVDNIKAFMTTLEGKSGYTLVILFFAVAAAFGTFISPTAALSIMLVFMAQLDPDGEVTPGRILLPVLGIFCCWKGFLPIGNGATAFATTNAKYEAIINNSGYMLKFLDPFTFKLIPTVCLTVYSILAWKMLPKEHKIDPSYLKEEKVRGKIPAWQEKLIYVVFSTVMISMVFNKYTGQYMYVIPIIGGLVLMYTGCLTTEEAIKGIAADNVWMIAGILTVSSAISKSGASEVIGGAVTSVFGANPNNLFVMFTLTGFTIVLTTFFSNTASQTIMITTCASFAAANGFDPRGMILATSMAAVIAVGFPSGDTACALTYSAGRYNPLKVAKWTFPYMLVAWVSIALTAAIKYPIYPR